MIDIRITNDLPTRSQLTGLYTDAGWTAYTADPERLFRSVTASLSVVTAWEGDALIGLARAVGDGETILYVQDILVHSAHQRRGIGTQLMTQLISRYPHVRQLVLLTDDSPATTAFYQRLGFRKAQDAGCVSFVRFQ